MKTVFKLVMAVTIAVMATKGGNAQLIINTNGNAHFGDTTTVDTTVTVHIAGAGSNGSMGKLAFGGRHNNHTSVIVGEYGTTDTDRLWLHGRNGLVFTDGEVPTDVFRFSSDSSVGLNILAPVSSRAAYIATDSRLNETSAAVNSSLQLLSSLSAISYRLRLPEDMGITPMDPGVGLGNGLNGGGEPYPGSGMTLEQDSLHYGLTLESVQQALPQLVTEDGDGIMYVDYNSLIPLLVVAVKELKQQVDDLTSRVEDLEDALEDGLDEAVPEVEGSHADYDTAENEDIVGGQLKPALYQNVPNPFNADTQIRYRLPESVQQADLYIYDLQGHQIKRITVEERGESSVTIHGSELQAGMYIYALIADGHEIDSKRMILTK